MHEAQVGQSGTAFSDFQEAALYRANCADETSGAANQWNRVYEAVDFYALAVLSSGDEAGRYLAQAHSLANELLGESLGAELRSQALYIWKKTKAY